jgi:L-2-hydroxycarboxylate dehydrogenase (NAD+)
MGDADTVTIERERAEDIAAEAFRAHGISDADADRTASVLVTADAMGKGSHGLLRLPRFVRGIEHGNVDPDGEITAVSDTGPVVGLDGGSRLGPVVATAAVDRAVERAGEYGIGAVGVHNTNHLGALGNYTDRARREGVVAMAMTNTEPAMPPLGGSEQILGTNPIAIGLPTEPPFNLDMSTSAISRGEVLRRKEAGETLPEDVALDAEGRPTTDPAEALEGVILPFGGAKGAGLAVAVEVLAGGLVGAAMGQDVTGTYHTEDPCTKGDLFLAIDPEAFGTDYFVDGAQAFLEALVASEPAADVDSVRLPGQHSIETESEATTIAVGRDLWETVQDLAESA